MSKIIGDQVKIRSLSYTDLSHDDKVVDDLILITTPVIKDLILPLIDPKCKCFIAKRTVNPKWLHMLFEIPPNTDVLVVNVLYESAVDLTEELHAIGITHANFHPYNPDKPPEKKINYAVTPGEPHLVPKDIPNVIDIGDRLISIITISQILYYLTGSGACDNLVTSRYIQNYVKLSMNLSEHNKYSQLLNRQMEMVISNFEDGVLLTDENKVITFHNKKAGELLSESKLIGKPLGKLFAQATEAESHETAFVFIKNLPLHITRKKVDPTGNTTAEMIIMKDLTQLRDIDEQYRKQKKHSGYTAKYMFADILHRSPVMNDLVNKAKSLAATDSTVLITGESGTGKELLAQSIHNASPRKGRPFVALSCAALSETLLESELFGYEEGAFTGARKGGKRGLFEIAHTGTILLDEIGDAPLSIQTKLLRVLQEKEIMRVAGDKVIPIDVRVLAATNKNLAELVQRREFREDLFYRLNVFPVRIPALRERKADIEILLDFFLSKYAVMRERQLPCLDASIIEFLRNYHWPGNIRQLENIAEYIITVGPASSDLKEDILQLLAPAACLPENTAKNLLLHAIANHPAKAELIAILTILADRKKANHLVGRHYIGTKLVEDGVNLSEQQIKTRLALLKKYGYAASFTGKGSAITAEGEQYLASLANRTDCCSAGL